MMEVWHTKERCALRRRFYINIHMHELNMSPCIKTNILCHQQRIWFPWHRPMFAQSKLIGHGILPFALDTTDRDEDRQAASREREREGECQAIETAIQFRQRRCTKNKQELIWIVNLSQLSNRLEIANSTIDRATVMKCAPRKHPKPYLNDVSFGQNSESEHKKNCTVLWNTFTAALFSLQFHRSRRIFCLPACLSFYFWTHSAAAAAAATTTAAAAAAATAVVHSIFIAICFYGHFRTFVYVHRAHLIKIVGLFILTL